MKYNYYEVMKEDIKNYIKENYESFEGIDKESLYDELWIEDSVTGNASGSYTFNNYEAEENICHNMDLLKEACDCFGCEIKIDNPEWCDVTIRCYLLGQVLDEVLEA